MTDADIPKFETIGDWRDSEALTGALLLPVDPDGRVLLQLRDYGTTRYPGRWGFFGGQVEAGETLRQAVVREFEEEAGVAIDPAAPQPLFRFMVPTSGTHLYLFQATLKLTPADIRLGEGAGFAFVGPEDFERLDLVEFVLAALRRWQAVQSGNVA